VHDPVPFGIEENPLLVAHVYDPCDVAFESILVHAVGVSKLFHDSMQVGIVLNNLMNVGHAVLQSDELRDIAVDRMSCWGVGN